MKRIIVPILAALAIVVALTACQAENQVKPFEWDVTATLAKHKDGATADHDNWKAVSSLVLKDKTIEIKADSTKMEEYLSSDPSQQDAPHKWFAILIGTGDDDIRNVSFNNTRLTDKDVLDRDDMLKADGTAASADEFVLWLNTENADGYRFMLSHETASIMTFTVDFTDLGQAEEELPAGNIATVNGIMKAAFAAFETFETGTEQFSTANHEGTAELTVDGNEWSLHVMADIMAAKAAAYDIEFTVTSQDVEKDRDIEILVGGTAYTVSASQIAKNVVLPEPPVPYEAPSNSEVKEALEEFFTEFGKVQGWDNASHSTPLYINSENLANFSGWNNAMTAYLDFGAYPEAVDHVSILGKHFKDGNVMEVSIGNNVFYADAGWKMEDGHLLVNKLFMFASLMFDEGFGINGKTFDYDLGYGTSASLTTDNWWNMEASSNEYASAEDLGGGEWDIVVSTMNQPLYSSYDGQDDTDVILALTDYTEEGAATRQLALLTGESSQFISYFYGWKGTYEESVEKLMTANDRDIADRGVVLASDGTVKGTYENTYHVSPAYIGSDDVATVYGYLEFPAHERIFNRINGFDDAAFAISGHTYEDGKLTITMSANGFEYQKVSGSHTITGDIAFTFSGTADGDVFKANSWAISTDGLVIDNGHEFTTEGFGGKISTDGALGTNPGTADFGLSGGDWDGTVKNPADATFCFALGIEGDAAIDGKVLLASMFNTLLQ